MRVTAQSTCSYLRLRNNTTNYHTLRQACKVGSSAICVPSAKPTHKKKWPAQTTKKSKILRFLTIANVKEERYTCHRRIRTFPNVDWNFIPRKQQMSIIPEQILREFLLEQNSHCESEQSETSVYILTSVEQLNSPNNIFCEMIFDYWVSNPLVSKNINVGWTIEPFEIFLWKNSHLQCKQFASAREWERRWNRKNCPRKFQK